MSPVSNSQQWGLTGTVVEVCDGDQVGLLVDLVKDLQHLGHCLALQAFQVAQAQTEAGTAAHSTGSFPSLAYKNAAAAAEAR